MLSYEGMGQKIGRIVDAKNRAYGNSFANAGRIMEVLFPKGIPPEQMDLALVLVRIVDKLGRIANDVTAFGEDPWMDIAGYAILMLGQADPDVFGEVLPPSQDGSEPLESSQSSTLGEGRVLYRTTGTRSGGRT